MLMDSAYKRLTAGKFTLSYLRPNYLWHVSQNIYYTHTHSNSHTHLQSHTLWLHSHIPATQLLDIWHFKQLEGPSSIIQTQGCNRTRSDCDDLAGEYHIVRPRDTLIIHLTPCAQWPSYWYTIDSSVCQHRLWLAAVTSPLSWARVAAVAFSAGFVKDVVELVWHHREWCLFDLQVTECHTQGDRCGVHGYNVNVLSPWRRSVALSQRGTATWWQLFILNASQRRGQMEPEVTY